LCGVRVVGLCAIPLLVACANAPPPHTRAAPQRADPPSGYAAVTFLWPPTSCDPAGYYTVASGDGYFAGNVGRGERLTVFVPAGSHTFLAWNPVLESKALPPQFPRPVDVAVLRAELAPGASYVARLAFGEWDELGPRELVSRRTGMRHCWSREPAFVALDPRDARAAADVSEWLAELAPTAPDLAAGQAALRANAEDWELHKGLAEVRLRRLRPEARALATLSAPRP
jgi:hypothetical protein